MSANDTLGDKSLLIIFTASPHGFGHLRVTDALYHGLPEGATPILIGAQDKIGSRVYRQISINPITREIMERIQNGQLGEKAAGIGRYILRSRTKHLYKELVTILNERVNVPKTALIVATHSIQAHQIAVTKQKLEKETGVKILFVVQVTDDSPQPIWYVPEADMIFVPSNYTRDELYAYAKKANLPHVPITVTAYPVSPLLSEELRDTMFEHKSKQVDPLSKTTTHVSIPISGAAIGTKYMEELLPLLHHHSERFAFYVVVQEAPFTELFIENIARLPYAQLFTAKHDRETVDIYETMYQQNTLSLEITKPSEQAFKALLTPRQRGGVIMLFTAPVGRQEYDNLNFMRSHRLMPHIEEQDLLWNAAQNNGSFPKELHVVSNSWRGLRLPASPSAAARFIHWSLEQGLFAKMLRYTKREGNTDVSSYGVKHFWEAITELLKKNSS